MTVAWRTEYDGLLAQQVPRFWKILTPPLQSHGFARIIEIGTGYGGFSLFLRHALPSAELHTWDIVQHLTEAQINAFQFEFHNMPAMEDIAVLLNTRLIEKPGKVLMICDGGDKIREFRTFAPLLKSGDVIMAHDYCQSIDIFRERFFGKIWNWMEICDQDIEDVVESNKLRPIHPELRNAVWGCWEKS